ncbi:MAG: lipopolysaccharide heptosyltransferase II [Phycisphaerae bacterium]
MIASDEQGMGPPERILVVLPSWVGDVVMATPVLRALRQRFADSSITLLGRPMMEELLAGTTWCDELLTWEPKGGSASGVGLFGLAGQLRRRRFEWALLLTNSFRSALLVRLAGVSRRVGYAREGREILLTDRLTVQREAGRIKITRMVDYYGRLAQHVGCDWPGDRLELAVDPASEKQIEERLAGLGLAKRHPLIVMSPGASFGAAKLWPVERFAELGDTLVQQHSAAVVISCAPGEEAIAGRIGEQMKSNTYVLDQPVTTLGQFKSLVKRCDVWVGNDAGARHIAKAFGKPAVTVFGPTHAGWTETEYPLERKVSVPVDCGPCQLKTCPLDHRCMTGVSVAAVAAAVGQLLDLRQDEAA